jgi:CopG family transcriptional regulator, nickel-responsive regulator
MKVRRFGVSIEESLLQQLDAYVKEKKFANRSRAIRHLIGTSLVRQKWDHNREVAGAIVLVYDHKRRNITGTTTREQHEHHHLILSVQHVHLDHDLCLETIAVKGKARQLIMLADTLISTKGIKHGELVMTEAD